MKFFAIASLLALISLTIAAPTVELVEKRQSDQSAFAQSCAAKKGTLACCQSIQQPQTNPAQTGGLIGALIGGVIPTVGVQCVNLVVQVAPALCNQVNVCCSSEPQAASQSPITGLVNVLPNAQICPAVTL